MNKLPNYNPDCDNTLEWAFDIETQVEEKILEISLNIDNIAKSTQVDISEVLKQQLENLNGKLKRMYNLYADGNDAIIETINELEKQKKDVKKKLDLEHEKELTKNKKQESIKEIKKIADVWEHIDKKDKNTILKSIIEKIMISKGNIEIRLKNF